MMHRLFGGWTDRFRSVGGALLDVWQAEWASLGDDLRRSAGSLRGGLVLTALAAGIAFWSVGLLFWLAVELLSLTLERWQAGVTVLAATVLLAVIVFLAGRRRLQRVENPLTTVQRRGREHVEWVQHNLISGLGGGADPEREPTEDD